jgi:16S rRNA (guanine527-N7)-methyltransferase
VAVDLPPLDRAEIGRRLATESPEVLSEATQFALAAHYEELRKWGRRLSLIGPGTVSEVLGRHYGESLAALPWCPDGPLNYVDFGSGGGFPGYILASARPQWRSTLVEPRVRKWAFLEAAVRKGRLSCRCLNARVDADLPEGLPCPLDVVSVRALRLSSDAWNAITGRLSDSARVLWWQGEESGEWPLGLREVASRPLAGSRLRRLVWAEPVR